MTQPVAPSSLPRRLIGVVTLKAPVYREIARDASATAIAAVIAIGVAAVTGLGQLLTGHIFDFIVGVIGAALTWLFGAFVAALIR